MTAAKVSRPPARAALVKLVAAALDDMKAVNVKILDVRKVTDVTDCVVVASGNSDRHVRSIADRVVERAKQGGYRPIGVEGERDGEWVLVDLNDVIVHVMLPRVREFYALESLWEAAPARVRTTSPKAKAKSKAKAKAKAKGKSSAASRPRGKSAARPARKPSGAGARPAAGSTARSAARRPSGTSRGKTRTRD